MSSPPGMQPCHLDFTNSQSYSNMSTPQSSRSTQSRTPITLTPTFSDNSPQTSESSSLTPSLSVLKFGRGCGHPCKQIVAPPMMISLMEEVMSIKRNGLNARKLKYGDSKSGCLGKVLNTEKMKKKDP